MKTFETEVTLRVRVKVDEARFDEQFMKEFHEQFYSFDTIEEHVQHITQLFCRGLLSKTFVEGYGPPSDMGISIAEPEVVEMEVPKECKPIERNDFMAYP